MIFYLPEIFHLRSQKRVKGKQSSGKRSISKLRLIPFLGISAKSIREFPMRLLPKLGQMKPITEKADETSKIKTLRSRLGHAIDTSKATLTSASKIRLPFRRSGENRSCTFMAKSHPGSRMRRYTVHVPPSYTWRRSAPLVMVLPFYGSTSPR